MEKLPGISCSIPEDGYSIPGSQIFGMLLFPVFGMLSFLVFGILLSLVLIF